MRERDTLAEELKPWLTLAEQQFPTAPPAQRLSLLEQRVGTLTAAMSGVGGRRHLDAEAIARIRAQLDHAPGLEVEIGGIWQDPEALALADELRLVFESAGLKTRRLAQYTPADGLPAGVSIYSKHELDQVLSAAISRIFLELEQPEVQWLEDPKAQLDPPPDRQPDLKIIVGRR